MVIYIGENGEFSTMRGKWEDFEISLDKAVSVFHDGSWTFLGIPDKKSNQIVALKK